MSDHVLLRPVPVESVLRRLRAEAKILALIIVSFGLAFHPDWWLIGPMALLTVGLFALSRLPLAILPKPPRLLLFFLSVSILSAGFGGDGTKIAGLSVGAMADVARLVSVGILLVLWALLLAWTTGLAEVGSGMIRLIRPLRRIGVPAEELGTAIALTVRMVPLVLSEVRTTVRAWQTRPDPVRVKERFLVDSVAMVVDVGAVVVTNSYRRAIELAQAMVARDSTRAPAPEKLPLRPVEVLVVLASIATTVSLFIWG